MKTLIKITSVGITAALLNAGALFAQSPHELSVSLGGGLSGLQYKPEVGSKSLGMGGLVGVGYSYFFEERFGIGTGVEVSFYGSKLKNGEFTNVIRNITDPSDGKRYDFHTAASNYSDKQRATYLNIPILFHYRHGNGLNAAGGLRVGIPIGGKSESTASFTNKGYFPDMDNYAETQKFMGFGVFSDMKTKEDLELKAAFMLSIEGGWQWELSNGMLLYTGAYFDYGLNNIAGDKRNIIEHSSIATGAEFSHHGALSSNYSNGSATTAIADKTAPLAVGVKVAIDMNFDILKK